MSESNSEPYIPNVPNNERHSFIYPGETLYHSPSTPPPPRMTGNSRWLLIGAVIGVELVFIFVMLIISPAPHRVRAIAQTTALLAVTATTNPDPAAMPTNVAGTPQATPTAVTVYLPTTAAAFPTVTHAPVATSVPATKPTVAATPTLTATAVPTAISTPQPTPTATATPIPLVTTTDDLNNFRLTYSHSGDILCCDTGYPQDFAGDTSRAIDYCNPCGGNIVWKETSIQSATFTIYFSPNYPIVENSFAVSDDGVNWTGIHATYADNGGVWDQRVYTLTNLGGATYIRTVWNSPDAYDPELGQATITHE